MKYERKKLEGNKSILIDETAKIKPNTNTFIQGLNGDWFYNSVHKDIARIGDITAFDFKVIATINHSIDKDIPMVFIDDEVEKLAEESTAEVIQVNADFSLKEVYKEFFKDGYNARKQEGRFYSEEDLRKAMLHSSSCNSSLRGVNNYIESLKQEYVELETESVVIGHTGTHNIFGERFKTTRDESGQLIAYKAQ